MLKLLSIYKKGYAGHTMGGTSYMIHLDVPEDRFPEIEQRGCDGYMLNVVVPNEDDGTELRFRLTTKTIYEDGEVGFWREDEVFTAEEIQYMHRWCEENQIREDAANIKREIKKVRQLKQKKRLELFELVEKGKVVNTNAYNKIREELDELQKQDDILHGEDGKV